MGCLSLSSLNRQSDRIDEDFDETNHELKRDNHEKVSPGELARPEGEDVYDEDSGEPEDDFTADERVRFTQLKSCLDLRPATLWLSSKPVSRIIIVHQSFRLSRAIIAKVSVPMSLLLKTCL